MEHSAPDRYEMHAIVKGRVQGIGFRSLTHRIAHQLAITGTVCNLPDGSVEIYAQGSKQQLEELMKQINYHALPGSLEDAFIEYFPIEMPQDTFRILG